VQGVIAEAPVIAEVMEEEISRGQKMIEALEDSAKVQWKAQNEDIVRMYGQVAIFKDKTERLGQGIGRLNTSIANNMKKIKDSASVTRHVELQLRSSQVAPAATLGKEELQDMQVLPKPVSRLKGSMLNGFLTKRLTEHMASPRFQSSGMRAQAARIGSSRPTRVAPTRWLSVLHQYHFRS
jgi:hypothetical protein